MRVLFFIVFDLCTSSLPHADEVARSVLILKIFEYSGGTHSTADAHRDQSIFLLSPV